MPRSRVGSNLVDLNLLLTNNAPLSWDDRRSLLYMVETDFKDVSHNQQHLSDEEVKRNILQRVSFAHFPCLSVCETTLYNGMGDDTSTPSSSSSSSTRRDRPSMTSSNDANIVSSLPALQSSFLVNPLERGSHMLCNVVRYKSTLHTTYKMYLETILPSKEDGSVSSHTNADNGNSGINSNAPDNRQPLLIAKMSSGLTLSCNIHSYLQGEEASNLIAKVTKSGKYYSINPVTPSAPSLGTCGRAKVSMRYRVMDKIIYLDCVADLNPTSDRGHLIADDSSLQSSLEKIKKNESVLLPGNLFGLRTRKPRYTSAKEHQVSFGGVGRSRTPSKKNVILDYVDGRSAEWSASEQEAYPPFQLGKKSEDHFSLDFSDLSPVQAFGIALAVFAQT